MRKGESAAKKVPSGEPPLTPAEWAEVEAMRARIVRRGPSNRYVPLELLRKGHGLTQEDVAERMGISQAAVSLLEKQADGGDMMLSSLERYAQALGGKLEVRIVTSAKVTDEDTGKPIEITHSSRVRR